MNTLSRLPAVFVFEWRRALTIPRLAWMAVLIAFPPFLLFLVRSTARSEPPQDIASILVFILSPCVACVMAVFLWATPVVSSELEGRSWVYLAVRPYGTRAVLLGKYLVAVSWSLPVGIISAALSVIVLLDEPPPRLLAIECALSTLSCISYSALFLLIGVVVPKRAMVAAIVYTFIGEVAFSTIPAAVNLFTIQFRLRCMLVRWMDFQPEMVNGNPVYLAYFGEESAAWHAGVLLAMTAAYLLIASLLLRFREFTFAAETET